MRLPEMNAVEFASKRDRGTPRGRRLAALAALCLLAVSCTWIGDYAEKRADIAAYEIIAAKQNEALGEASPLTIGPVEDPATERLLADADEVDRSLDGYTTPTYLISLSDAVAIAIANNRAYKTQKEGLYSQALGLTETRRDFQPLFSASGDASRTRSETGHGTLAGSNVERFGSRGFSGNVNKILATGATFSMNFSHSFVHYFSQAANRSASNDFSVSLVQPLLRGAGRLTAHESLRQGERSMIYNVRDFRRYQQSFIIDIATRYYDLLRIEDQLLNVRRSHASAVRNHRKLQSLSRGGDYSMMDVDQARQEVLLAEASLSRTRKNSAARLDQFKLFLGIPVDLSVGADPKELQLVAQRGFMQPDMKLSDAVDAALNSRLDLKNMVDQIADGERGVKIARQNFLPTLDAQYSYSTSKSDDKDRIKLDFKDNNREASISLGVPFDWTPRRNDYRRSQISLIQAKRAVEEFREQLILEVRDAWRSLEESRTDYGIQEESVELAERRVRQATLNIQRGLGIARDLFEAEDALLSSQNALTDALVSNTIQRMEFWNTIERFDIDDQGQWTGTTYEDISPAVALRPDSVIMIGMIQEQ